ncbi:4-phosphopantetheinyl transferase [Duganella sp. CY15W]|uniref:4'-phosphopantetheinyl transferase family protein n=1 Tax=Duganella sp. CY15W TaxID=2692172 RepID=UPI001369A790|nr:4-phosphopantetheinyl transferase [Duganella sp. CY15W]MYM27647.1 4-phosphopantetheinyl transferase [Duganella sp. CY15W]
MKTMAVQLWPGPVPVPQDGLFAILIDLTATPPPAGPQRDIARSRIRLATREALAAVLRVRVGDISIASQPGEPPRILLAGSVCRIGCSFSHDGNYALAAINLQGPVGTDLMQIQDIPDWQAVVRDYLGPDAVAALLTAADRPLALAEAWTRYEARLKLSGLHLSEWTGHAPDAAIHLQSLILPAGMAGTLAYRPSDTTPPQQ